jgi:hypothetical protein
MNGWIRQARSLEGRGFPVVLPLLAGGRPAASSLEPELVAEHLARAYCG